MALTTPISRWKFDGNTNDLYGAHNLTNNGITFINSTKRSGNYCANLVYASAQYAYTSINVNAYTAYSITGWFKSPGSATFNYFINEIVGTSSNYIDIYFINNHNYVTFSKTSSYTINSGVVNDNNWHFYALVDNNGAVAVYMDGASVNTASYVRGSETYSTYYFGHSAGGANFGGNFDDMRLYNVALSATDVAVLYRSYSGEQAPLASSSL